MLKCIFFDSSILERSSIFFFSFSSLNEEISFFLFFISSKKLFGSILFIFGYTPYPDSNAYIQLAQKCIEANEQYPIVSEINTIPFIWNLGAINAVYYSLKLFGSITPLFVFYSLIKGFSAWLIYYISKILFNNKIALTTLILYVVYPANYGECTSTLS